MHRVWVKSMVFANTGKNHWVSNWVFSVSCYILVLRFYGESRARCPVLKINAISFSFFQGLCASLLVDGGSSKLRPATAKTRVEKYLCARGS